MNRRNFFKAAAGGALLANGTMRGADMSTEIVDYMKPVFNLHKFFNAPVKIE
jgi:hypothetical protein